MEVLFEIRFSNVDLHGREAHRIPLPRGEWESRKKLLARKIWEY